jgi:hypothetical protein
VSNQGTVLKSVDSKNGAEDALLIFAATVSGNALRTSLVCNLSGQISYAYEATADSLPLHDTTSLGGVTRVHAFTKL